VKRLFSKGQVVFSKSGRDKSLPFIVVDFDENYVYLADGRLRLLEKPKKKKKMHVQICNDIIEEIKSRLEDNLYLNDADLRKALKPYRH
jgi:ribosomal protein L14E/L6E/L27E